MISLGSLRRARNLKSGHVRWDEVGEGVWDFAMMRDLD